VNYFETKEITLVEGTIVTIPIKFSYFRCREPDCKADDLIWATTANGHKMPIHFVEGQGMVSHFSDCKGTNKFRKEKQK